MTTASDNLFPKVLLDMQTAAPAAPSDADWKLYAKPGGIYARSSNSEVGPFGTAGAGSSSFVGARAYNDGTQSISDATITAVTFASESFDTNTIHDTGTNTSRFTVSSTGYWRFNGGGAWDNNSSGARYLWWRIDGTTEIDGGMVVASHNSGTLAQQTSITLSLTSGQYVELIAYQTSGGARAFGGTSADKKFEAFVECHYLGA